MKKMIAFLLFAVVFATTAYAARGPHGSAPNSGDGIPDGSGFESPFGPWK